MPVTGSRDINSWILILSCQIGIITLILEMREKGLKRVKWMPAQSHTAKYYENRNWTWDSVIHSPRLPLETEWSPCWAMCFEVLEFFWFMLSAWEIVSSFGQCFRANVGANVNYQTILGFGSVCSTTDQSSLLLTSIYEYEYVQCNDTRWKEVIWLKQ